MNCESWLTGEEVLSPGPPVNLCSPVRAFTDQAVWSGSVGSVVCSCALLPSPWASLAYWPRQLCRLRQPMPQNFHSVRLGVWKKASALEIRTCRHWFKSKNDCILSLMSVRVCETPSVCSCLCVWELLPKLSICLDISLVSYHKSQALHSITWAKTTPWIS